MLTRLLAWLDRDPIAAGERYVQFEQALMAYVEQRGAHDDPKEIADEALDRVDKRLATSLLNEHHNSTEIYDVLSLCRVLHDQGAKSLPNPSRRVWQFLSLSSQTLVTTIARTGTFEHKQRSILSHALNEILRRRDFYSMEDFKHIISEVEFKDNPLLEKIAADLARGLTQLSQDECERFNRRLLEAAYPAMIKTNLGDTPDEEKLRRCKYFARLVLLERKKKLVGEEALPPVSAPEVENADEQRQMLMCLEECKRLKLSPRDYVVLEKYFTGIQIRSPEDEPLSDAEITAVRKSLAEELGVAPETIRTIAHRSKEIVFKCIERCLKRSEKK
jgi:hypothetical protein